MTTLSPTIDTFCHRLHPAFGNRLRTDTEALVNAAGDESGLPPCQPAAVLFPADTAELVLIAKESTSLGIGLVPRGGGTGKAGGCIPTAEQVVVDLSRMNRILELRAEDLYAVVQPGVITQDLDRAALETGLMYAPDPGSSDSCTLGGNISTNAGGSRVVKYGATRRYVWGLELVLPDGSVLRTGRRSLKGVGGLDLTSLVVGSEGTLAFVTEATLHLIPAPKAVETAWVTFPDLMTASRAGEQMLARGALPRIMEVMDKAALDAVRPRAPFRIPEKSGAALLIETDGAEDQASADLLRLVELAIENGATDSYVASSGKQRAAMRETRRLVSTALKDLWPHKISDDVAVPKSRMIALLEKAMELGAKAGIDVSAYGHLGDGNLHINLHCRTALENHHAKTLRYDILRLVVAMRGSVSGEHGIGIAKREALALEQSSEVLAVQKQLKAVFDPLGIMNPGKVFL
jgi:glycolate oxidase